MQSAVLKYETETDFDYRYYVFFKSGLKTSEKNQTRDLLYITMQNPIPTRDTMHVSIELTSVFNLFKVIIKPQLF